MNEDVFPIKHGDIPASFVSLPEGTTQLFNTHTNISPLSQVSLVQPAACCAAVPKKSEDVFLGGDRGSISLLHGTQVLMQNPECETHREYTAAIHLGSPPFN